MSTENKNKPMTIEDLAIIITNGFNDIRSRMATKDDIADLMATSGIKGMRSEIIEMKERLSAEIRSIQNLVDDHIATFK